MFCTAVILLTSCYSACCRKVKDVSKGKPTNFGVEFGVISASLILRLFTPKSNCSDHLLQDVRDNSSSSAQLKGRVRISFTYCERCDIH